MNAIGRQVSPQDQCDEDDMDPPEWQRFCGRASEEIRLNMLQWLIEYETRTLGGGIIAFRHNSRAKTWAITFSHGEDDINCTRSTKLKHAYAAMGSQVYAHKENE